MTRKHKPITYGNGMRSKTLWKDIQAVADQFDGCTHDALYSLGCACQELEAYIETLEKRVEALEKRK